MRPANRSAIRAKAGRTPRSCSTGRRCCSPGSRWAALRRRWKWPRNTPWAATPSGAPSPPTKPSSTSWPQAYVKNTLARSNGYYGAWALNTGAAELPLAAATARVSATQAYYYASKENIQTHGGMGYTWEFDCQFHYRRAKLLSVNIGSEGLWQDKLVTALEQSNAA